MSSAKSFRTSFPRRAGQEEKTYDGQESWHHAKLPPAPRHRQARSTCRPVTSSFERATGLALDGQGGYVEGLAASGDFLFHHAWLTVNGIDALDPSVEGDPTHYDYFGIGVPNAVLHDSVAETQRYGVFPNAMYPYMPNAFSAYLEGLSAESR